MGAKTVTPPSNSENDANQPISKIAKFRIVSIYRGGPQFGGLGFAVRAVICGVMIVGVINKRKSQKLMLSSKSFSMKCEAISPFWISLERKSPQE